MTLTTSDGTRPSLSLTPPLVADADGLLFPVDPESVVNDPPSLQDGLRAAALLWCTHSTFPAVRAIAACAGIAASSVLWPYGTIERMRHALIDAERTALSSLVEANGGDLPAAVDERVATLAAEDSRLSKLPLLAALAAGVSDSDELALLAGAVRPLPAVSSVT